MFQNRISHWWDPVSAMDAIHREIEQKFKLSNSELLGGIPSNVQLWQNAEATLLAVELPHYSRDDLELTTKGRNIHLVAKKEELETAEYQILKDEWSPKGLDQTFKFPFDVDARAVKAEVVDGMLWLTVPKAAEEKPLKITIEQGA